MEKKFWDVLCGRRSVRNFTDEDVSQEKIYQIISAGTIAPSGTNSKNWDFIIIRSDEMKQKMRQCVEERVKELAEKIESEQRKKMFVSYAAFFTFFTKAPVVVAVLMKKYQSTHIKILEKYDKDMSYVEMAGIQNVAACIENMLLACTALDLGACWMTGPLLAKKRLEKVLSVEEPNQLVALVPIGVPKFEPQPNKIPELKDIKTI